MSHNALQPPQEVIPPQVQLPDGDYAPHEQYGQWGFGPIGSGVWPPETADVNWGQAYPHTDHYDPNQQFGGSHDYGQQPTYAPYEAQAPQPEQPKTVGRGRLAWEGLKKFFQFGRRNESHDADAAEAFDDQPQFSEQAESFWNGEQAVARAPRFLDQVHELRTSQGQSLRSNIITSQPRDILEGRRSKFQFTEREGLLDLDGFLGQVIRTAHGKADQASRGALESAMRMKEEFSFLGEKEFDEACDGIAKMWKEYLEHDEDNVLNIYNHQRVGFDGKVAEQKSYNVVLDKINERFNELIENEPYLALRVKQDPEKWTDAPGAKLIVVDDWMSSGNTIRTNAQKASAIANRMGVPGLADKTEVHVLIARADQSAVSYVVDGSPVDAPVRSYYKTAYDSGAHRLSLSGAHSSVDYGFETPLMNMQSYLHSQGIVRDAPLLTHIQREYRKDETELSSEQVQLLEEIASLNEVEYHLSTEAQTLSNEIANSPQDQNSPLVERRNAAYTSQASLHARRQALVDEYSRASNK